MPLAGYLLGHPPQCDAAPATPCLDPGRQFCGAARWLLWSFHTWHAPRPSGARLPRHRPSPALAAPATTYACSTAGAGVTATDVPARIVAACITSASATLVSATLADASDATSALRHPMGLGLCASWPVGAAPGVNGLACCPCARHPPRLTRERRVRGRSAPWAAVRGRGQCPAPRIYRRRDTTWRHLAYPRIIVNISRSRGTYRGNVSNCETGMKNDT